MLRLWGVETTVASDGVQAIHLFQENAYDLIIMDCQLPIRDGFETASTIRRIESFSLKSQPDPRPVPIVALTAGALLGDRERCIEAGMNDYLTKPLTYKKLFDVVTRYLARPSINRLNQHYNSTDVDFDLPAGPANLKSTIERFNRDKGLVISLAQRCFQNIPTLTERVRQSSRMGDADALAFSVHSMAGQASVFGADSICSLASEIELNAKNMDPSCFSRSLADFIPLVEEFSLQLGRFVSDFGS